MSIEPSLAPSTRRPAASRVVLLYEDGKILIPPTLPASCSADALVSALREAASSVVVSQPLLIPNIEREGLSAETKAYAQWARQELLDLDSRGILPPIERVRADLAKLPRSRRMLVERLLSRTGRDHLDSWPSQKTLAKELGCHTRTINRATADITSIGAVPALKRLRVGSKDRIIYALHPGLHAAFWTAQSRDKQRERARKQARTRREMSAHLPKKCHPKPRRRSSADEAVSSNKNNSGRRNGDATSAPSQHKRRNGAAIAVRDDASAPAIAVRDDASARKALAAFANLGISSVWALQRIASKGAQKCLAVLEHLDTYPAVAKGEVLQTKLAGYALAAIDNDWEPASHSRINEIKHAAIRRDEKKSAAALVKRLNNGASDIITEKNSFIIGHEKAIELLLRNDVAREQASQMFNIPNTSDHLALLGLAAARHYGWI